MVEDPGTLTVRCDECGDTIEIDTVAYAGGEGPTFGISEDDLDTQGWKMDGNAVHYCPECKPEEYQELEDD